MANVQAKPPVHPIPTQVLFDLGENREMLAYGRLLLFINRFMDGRFYYTNKASTDLLDKYFGGGDETLDRINFLIFTRLVYSNKKIGYLSIPNLVDHLYKKQQGKPAVIEFCTSDVISDEALYSDAAWEKETFRFLEKKEK